VGLWQNLSPEISVEGRYAHLDGDPRDFTLAGTLASPDGGLVMRLSYFQLLTAQAQHTIEFDPFYESLLELFPYGQARALVSKAFGDAWVLEGGVDVRRVLDQDDVGQFNRNFDRLFATASWLEGLPWDLQASVTVDSYDSQDDEVLTAGADLSRYFGEADRATIGTYYSLYKYDIAQNEERDDVRTWYVGLRHRLDDARRLDGRYEYEDAIQGEFHTLWLGFTWSF
jgi:hypothetical protein